MFYKFIKDKISPNVVSPVVENAEQTNVITITPKTTSAPSQRTLVYTEKINDVIKSVAKTGLINAYSVNVNGLNVRKGPSTSNVVLTSLPKDILIGASQYVLTKKVPDGWKVIIFPETYNGVKIRGGFVSDKYLGNTNHLYGQ
jgi:hypothetical protein